MFFHSNFNTTFLNISLTSNVSADVNLDDNITESSITLPTNFSVFDRVVAVNTTLSFSTTQLVIPYNQSAFLSESRIHAMACHNWSLTAQSCLGTWVNATNTSTIDTTNNKVTVNTTQLSAFAVAEHTVCGDSVKDTGEACDGSDFGSSTCSSNGFSGGSLTCSSSCTISTSSCTSSSGSSSSGGGGGGGSSAPTTTETKEETKSEEEKPLDDFVISKVEGVEKEDLEKIIQKALGNNKLFSEFKEALLKVSEEVSQNTDVKRDFEGSTIKTTIRYEGEGSVNNFIFYDLVPKSFASSTDDIQVYSTGRMEIVNKDPEYLFIYNSFSSGEDLEINYTVNKSFSSEQAKDILKELKSEVYGINIEKPVSQHTAPIDMSLIILGAVIVLIVIASLAYLKKG